MVGSSNRDRHLITGATRGVGLELARRLGPRRVGRLRDEVGTLDVLVNNAGISGAQRRPAEADPDDLEPVFATNVIGATRVLAACTPLLAQSTTLSRRAC